MNARRRLERLKRLARLRCNNMFPYPDHDETAFPRWLEANDPGEPYPIMTAEEWCDALEAGDCPEIAIMVVEHPRTNGRSCSAEVRMPVWPLNP